MSIRFCATVPARFKLEQLNGPGELGACAPTVGDSPPCCYCCRPPLFPPFQPPPPRRLMSLLTDNVGAGPHARVCVCGEPCVWMSGVGGGGGVGRAPHDEKEGRIVVEWIRVLKCNTLTYFAVRHQTKSHMVQVCMYMYSLYVYVCMYAYTCMYICVYIYYIRIKYRVT